MSTELDLLAAARPNFQSVADGLFTEVERRQLIDTITAAEPQGISSGRVHRPTRANTGVRAHRRRWPAAAIVAAAAAFVVVSFILPSGTPGGPNAAAAAALRRLAVVAVGPGGPTVGLHQFQFTDTTFTQYGSSAGSTRYQQWQAPDGNEWTKVLTASGANKPVGCYYYPSDAGQNRQYPEFDSASQAFLNTLPTNPATLRDYLNSHILVNQGGAPAYEQVLSGITDLLTNGSTRPALRAAAIRVLALDTRHVTAQNNMHDAQGRSTTMITFAFDRMSSDGPGATIENGPGLTESLLFDPSTSQLLQIANAQQGKTYATEVITSREIANSVPTDLLRCVAAKPVPPAPR